VAATHTGSILAIIVIVIVDYSNSRV
jgi:hypothetical protein